MLGWALPLLLTVPLTAASDWPQFRGPTGQGHSTEHGLPLEWAESRNIEWIAPVPGLGWSSPVVASGRVWLTTAVTRRDTSLRVLAYDAATGREVVNVEVFGREFHDDERNLHNVPFGAVPTRGCWSWPPR